MLYAVSQMFTYNQRKTRLGRYCSAVEQFFISMDERLDNINSMSRKDSNIYLLPPQQYLVKITLCCCIRV